MSPAAVMLAIPGIEVRISTRRLRFWLALRSLAISAAPDRARLDLAFRSSCGTGGDSPARAAGDQAYSRRARHRESGQVGREPTSPHPRRRCGVGPEMRDLFDDPMRNVLLLKASYWLNF